MPPAVETLLLRNSILFVWELRALWVTAALSLCSSLLYLGWLLSPNDRFGRWGSNVLRSGAAVTAIIIALRATRAGWPPFQTSCDGLMWFALSASITYLIVERRLRNVLAAGFVLSVILAVTFLFASLHYPVYTIQTPSPHQSNWFVSNLAASSIAYGVLAAAFSIESGYVALTNLVPSEKLSAYGMSTEMTARLHRFAHQLVLFGFPLLTVGIICGSLWQERMRGRYLPYETEGILSVATWAAYALYLHSMTMARWRGERASTLNVLGFVILILTLFGIGWLRNLIWIPGFLGR